MEISRLELRKLIADVSRDTVILTLQQLGLLKTTYMQSEIIKLYGMAAYKKSLMYVKWQKKGESRSSQVICMRSEFDEYLRQFDIELKPIL
jgi:hypothetical protein